MDDSFDQLFKVLVIGDSGVGKTCLLLRFAEGIFSETTADIHNDFKSKTLLINDQKVKLQIWDTAGQERFRTITSSYYRGAHGILLVYDVSDTISFNNIKQWIQEIDTLGGNPNVAKILVGNKCDLGEEDRQISVKMGEEFGEMEFPFLETSAKDDIRVGECFELLAKEILSKDGDSKNQEKIMLFNDPKRGEQKKSKCCA